MRFASRFALAVALISFVACLPARAQQVEVEVGQSLVCDTQQQVERFVALFDGNAETTLAAVNAEEKDSTACAVLAIAYVRGHEIATARTRTGTYRIIRILVLGLVTHAGVMTATPAAFYSIVQIDERDA